MLWCGVCVDGSWLYLVMLYLLFVYLIDDDVCVLYVYFMCGVVLFVNVVKFM